MRSKLLILALVIALCLLFTACGCNHEWQDADCVNPKACLSCGETEGDALGHSQDAWVVLSINPITLERTSVQRCKTCDTVLGERKETLTTLHDGSKFLLTPSQIAQRLEHFLSEAVGEGKVRVRAYDDEGYKLSITLSSGNANIPDAVIFFSDGENPIPMGQEDMAYPRFLTAECSKNSDLGIAVALMLPVVMDPTVDYDISYDILSEGLIVNEVERNGIYFFFGEFDDVIYVGADLKSA